MIKKVLRYRYTLDELNGMLCALQERSQAYQDWLQQVETLLDGVHVNKPGQGAELKYGSLLMTRKRPLCQKLVTCPY